MKLNPPARPTRISLRTASIGIAALALMLLVGTGARALLGEEAADSSTGTETTGESGTGAGDSNVAVGANTRDGSEVYAVRLKIVQTDGPVVDPTNAAVAAASCNDCTTVAIAIEGVLVAGTDVTEVTPVNLALALNTDCSGCQTLAAAYQYVTQNDTRVRITGTGRQQVASLRQQLNTLRLQGLSLEEVAAEADRIAMEFYAVLVNEVVPIGNPSGEFPTPVATSTGTASAEPTPSNTGATPSPSEASPTIAPSSSGPTQTPSASGPSETAAESGATSSATPTGSSSP